MVYSRRSVLVTGGLIALSGCAKVAVKGAKVASKGADEAAKGADEVSSGAKNADEAVDVGKGVDESASGASSASKNSDDADKSVGEKAVDRIKRERREERIEDALEERNTETPTPVSQDTPVTMIDTMSAISEGYFRYWNLEFSKLVGEDAEGVLLDYSVQSLDAPVDIFLFTRDDFSKFESGGQSEYFTYGSSLNTRSESLSYLADFRDYVFVVDNTSVDTDPVSKTSVMVKMTAELSY